MANYEKEIFDLGQIKNYLSVNLVDLSDKERSEALRWFSLGASYYNQFFRKDQGHKVSAEDFQKEASPVEIQEIIDYYVGLKTDSEDQEKRKTKSSAKEDITVPAELESLVALYKEAQAEKIEVDTSNSVAETVKRARKTWLEKNRIETIRQNRLTLIQDKSAREKQREMDNLERDLFLIKNTDPKAESTQVLYQNALRVSRQAIIAQAAILGTSLTPSQINKAVEELVYLGQSGTVDFTTDFKNLNLLSQLAIKNQGGEISAPIKALYEEVISLETTDQYSKEADDLETRISAEDKNKVLEESLNESTQKLQRNLVTKNPDIEDNLEIAHKELEKIQTGLLNAIPNAEFRDLSTKVSPLTAHAKEFETALRQVPELSSELKINPSYHGSQASSLISTVKGETRNISPEAVRLLAIGVTPERIQKAEVYAQKNPNTPIGKLYLTNRDVFQQVHYQIEKLRKTKLGAEIEKTVKPLTGLSSTVANAYNRRPAVQIAKVAFDPIGTARSWAGREAGRQIGQRLLESSGNAIAKKLGGYLMEHGLQGGINAFGKAITKEALAKAATWAALKLGISLSAESLNAILPGLGVIVDLAAQVLVYLAEKTIGAAYNGFQNLAESIYGERIKARDVLAPLVFLGGAAAGAGAAAFGGLVFIVRTAQVAIISAAGILIGAFTIISLYLSFAYLVAPVLSTLVQFDSREKVDYSSYGETVTASTDCAWPTTGHYSIITGPNGGTHHMSHLEAIDIGAPNGSPFLAVASGTVSFTGVYSNYGNTVQVQTKTSAGTFVAFYAHLSRIMVGKGQQIAQGKPVGLVGGSGGWSPHIHLEYKGIKYNQCPAGGLKIKEGCCSYSPSPICTGACNAFSN